MCAHDNNQMVHYYEQTNPNRKMCFYENVSKIKSNRNVDKCLWLTQIEGIF